MTDQPDDQTLLEFPVEFPIKIMGPNTTDFIAEIKQRVTLEITDLPESAWSHRPSGSGNYIGLTVTFVAESQAQLDAVYSRITSHPDVKMCL